MRMGLTQEQFAARLQLKESDMTRQVVANIEARRRRVFEEHIRLIIKVSHCNLDELFFGDSAPEKPISSPRPKPSRR